MTRDISQDFHALSQHLSHLDFRALSSGIGIGKLKVDDARRFRKSKTDTNEKSLEEATRHKDQATSYQVQKIALQNTKNHFKPSLAMPLSALPLAPSLPAVPSLPAEPSPFRMQELQPKAFLLTQQEEKTPAPIPANSLHFRKLLARLCDFIVVSACVLGSSFAFFYALEGASFVPEHLYSWFMSRWLALIGPVECLAISVGGLLSYTLIFRILAGATIGDMLLKTKKLKARRGA